MVAAMTQATREKKIAFIKSFGRKALEEAIMAAVYRHGAEHFLTDEQLDEITSEQVQDARSAQHRIMRNRPFYQAERFGECRGASLGVAA